MSTLEVVPAAPDDPSAAPSGPTRWFDCSDPAVGAAVRAHVLLTLNLRAVDTDVIADAMVVVSELVSNVHDHTPSEQVGVRVRIDADEIAVAVVEDRPFAAPGLPPAPRTTAFTLDERGRGLQIVAAVAADWGFVREDGVTTAWFALAASPLG